MCPRESNPQELQQSRHPDNHEGLIQRRTFESVADRLWVALFIYSKFFELIDTVLLLLASRSVILLHWWHHLTVLLYCWHAYSTRPGTGLWYAAMNHGAPTLLSHSSHLLSHSSHLLSHSSHLLSPPLLLPGTPP